ncbi:hypothetical protein BU26DRAFT_525700 [Trematosphaeria pertusa]|uniref:Uncharacterized protein n=1 Tax=Trematosphaeria pertusa TaxID=390896 RepID=A0A6A6HSL6_9PLEO|nr:uncharacterized protein BU26DRAFT_525700 [Trematosphaeria pertusa]KAF2240792.1 hypothetical protein BU26DRAFT_525700 [Trematosphaeria pertusa]
MPTKQPGPYFVIPTLPIAFPSQFFSALASYVPITHLTVASMLSYPSAYLLAVSSGLKGVLRSKLPNFWKDQGPVDAEEEALWTTFFDHLLRGREMLIMRNGAELPVDEGDGYGHMDLEMWIAGWLAERQMKGMREKGLEEKARIRSSMGEIAAAGDEIEEGEDGDAEMDESDGEDESEDEDEVAGEESEQEAEDRDEVEAMDLMPEHEDPTLHLGNDTTLLDLEHLDTIHVGQGRTGPRRVSWNEGELASFFEIPARPTKKGKVRANR